VVLNGIFLFDIQLMRRLESWKTANKDHFLNWIDIIGELDAFISIGIHACNHPHHVYPEVTSGSFVIHAEGVGHPLISHSKLVRNNYRLDGFSRIDLLTGANMAGKSTFLRTIGVNFTLAMMGAPVCADKFVFTPVLLFTSLRTNDSLQENESFFYAELKRLQQLISQYEQGKQVFFLLDEILKGTNSADQHKGSKELIKKLIRLKGIGIIATHDVELSKLEKEFPANLRNLCFEISIEEDKLFFDYTLKEGVCATMNASYLMKKMGII
jgi:DNA mismatch repair ATPase MutS